MNASAEKQKLFPVSKVIFHMDKKGKLLKKLWCCISERVSQGNLVLSSKLIKCKLASVKSFKTDILSIRPSAE